MNVMWYTHLADHATGHFFDSFGFSERYFREANSGCFALAAHYRYLAEIHVGQKVTVRTRALGRSAKRLHFIHFFTLDLQASKLSATVETLATHTDMSIRRSSPLPDHLAAAFDQLVAEHGKLPWKAPLCGAIHP